jgi:hypothetical protein
MRWQKQFRIDGGVALATPGAHRGFVMVRGLNEKTASGPSAFSIIDIQFGQLQRELFFDHKRNAVLLDDLVFVR